VYTRALARRRLGIPIGNDAAAERWSVSSVEVSLIAACPLLPLALWALAGNHSSFLWVPQVPLAHNEQSAAVPTIGAHFGRWGVGVLPPLEADDDGGEPDNRVLVDDCWILAISNGGGG